VFEALKRGAIMAEEGFKLKLTAILSADDEGYSCLMHDTEEPTSHRLSFTLPLRPTLASNNGSPSLIGQLDVMKGNT